MVMHTCASTHTQLQLKSVPAYIANYTVYTHVYPIVSRRATKRKSDNTEK